jgi:tetratricopeptide (TPR) repeat protein
MLRAGGKDCTPRGRKACAILAMLGLSPDNKRSRVWLQDRLWGSRGPEQGAASLRQSLSEIRRALGDEQGALITDRYVLALDRSRFAFDLDQDVSGGVPRGSELLEGFDIGEEGFEDWLRGERQKLGELSPPAANECHVVGPTMPPGDRRPNSFQNRVVLVRGSQTGTQDTSVIADSLLDSVAKTITELGAAKVLDRRVETGHVESDDHSQPHETLSLRSDVFGSDTRQIVRLALLQAPANTLAWSSTLQLSGRDTLDLNDPGVMRCINLVVNVAIDHFIKVRLEEGSERTAASAFCHSGILHLFRLGKINFETADRLFASAFEIEPRGIYLAWRAYLRTFLLAERQYTCRQTIEAEALDFMYRALEMEPHNSYVAGLSAHVQAMMRRSYVAAYELAERSIQLNHANPIGWACLGIAKSYLGKSEEGFHHTLLARAIAGSAPFRYQIDALSCIAGTMAGELDKAVHLAEASHALAPTFAPPLRYLSALYAHNGRHDRSFEMVRKLQANEPDFSYDKLRDKAYPAAGLHRTSIIDSLPVRQV